MLCGLAVTGDQTLNGIPTQGAAATVGKGGRLWITGRLAEPGFHERDGFRAKRRSALLPALPLAAHVGSGAQSEIVAAESDQFRAPQSRLYRDEKKRLVATADPGRCVGRANKRIDFVPYQVLDRRLRAV